MAPRRATEHIDAESQSSVRLRRWVSSLSSETVPSLRTPSISQFCGCVYYIYKYVEISANFQDRKEIKSYLRTFEGNK